MLRIDATQASPLQKSPSNTDEKCTARSPVLRDNVRVSFYFEFYLLKQLNESNGSH
jgi:hypothetical protein